MIITAGGTNRTIYVYFVDDDGGTAPGEPTTGLLFSNIETGGSASYCRVGAERTDFTLVTLASASAAHTDGGFILVDDTNMPGLYRLDLPDAATASGVSQVVVSLVAAGANNTVMRPVVIDLTGDLSDVATKTDTDANAAVTDALVSGVAASPDLLQLTDIATLSSQTSFTLTAGSADDDAYNGATIIIEDSATATQKAFGVITDYTGSSKTVTLGADLLAGFVYQAGDTVRIITSGSGGVTAAEVNAEVVDVLKTDVVTLPGQEAPPLTPTFEEMISWLYKVLRNRTFQNATEWRVYADNETTVDAKATVSDDGTDAIKQEIVSGP